MTDAAVHEFAAEHLAILRLLADPSALKAAVTVLANAADAHKAAKDEAAAAVAARGDLTRRETELEKREADVTAREAALAAREAAVSVREKKIRIALDMPEKVA
jgi:hypothetical protein